MKTQSMLLLWFAGVCMLFSTAVSAQDVNPADSTGLPGDHFSLEGAIELFKKAKSPEDFEKQLNSENNNVNNLDLNEDGEIDYIRVVDNKDGDVHAIVLQVPVSEKEAQDIAVIEIERQNADYTILQIIGDADIYGETVISEPFEEETSKTGRGGPSVDLKPYRLIVNVSLWPSVRYIYRPGYVVYASPWRWRHYPTWWSPWRPRPWRVYYVGVRPYRRHCHVVTTHRVVRAHKVYTPRRRHSTVVRTRTTTIKTRRATGTTTAGKRTTTTVNKNTNGRVTKQKTTTTVSKNRNGRVTAQKSTTTKTNSGRAVGKKTTTTKAARTNNGRAVGKKSTTTKAARSGKNSTTVRKRTTTSKAAKGKKGRVTKQKTTKTTVRKRRGG